MKKKLTLLAFIWISWIGIFLISIGAEVKEDDIEHVSGVVQEASCITSRSVNGLKILMSHNGKLMEEYLNLPGNFQCENNVVEKFRGEHVIFSMYENRCVGLTIGELVVLDVQDGINRANSKTGSITLSFFLATILSVLVLIRRA